MMDISLLCRVDETMQCNETKIKKLLAWEMFNNPATNPEGLPLQYFEDRVRNQPMTPQLKAEYKKAKVAFPKYGVENDYSKMDTLSAKIN